MIPASSLAAIRRRRCTPLSQQPIIVTIDLPAPFIRRPRPIPVLPPVDFSFTTNAIGITSIDVVDEVTFFALATADPIPFVPALAVYLFNGQISGTIDGLPFLLPPTEALLQLAVRINGVVAIILEPALPVTITGPSTPFVIPFNQTPTGIFVDTTDVITFDLEVTLPTAPAPIFTVTIDPTSTVGIVNAVDNVPFARRR